MDGTEFHQLKAMLDWQVEMGATEAIGDRAVNRYDAPAEVPKPKRAVAAAPVVAAAAGVDPVSLARASAAAAGSLAALAAAMAGYEHCELKRGARQLVFADGNPAARVMIVGEAPGRDEDRAGLPFVGQAGQLLDRMLAAIGLDRNSADPATAVYITNVIPWRPPENREPSPEEIAMMTPYPGAACRAGGARGAGGDGQYLVPALLGQRGITRLQGQMGRGAGAAGAADGPSGLSAAEPGREAPGLGRSAGLQARLRGS